MRFNSLADAGVMERISRGPAASAGRLQRARLAAVGCDCDPRGNRMLAGVGALGQQSTGNVVGSKAGGAAAGYIAAPVATTAVGAGLSAAGYASAGAVAGPIGAVVGLIVGIVVTKLLTKQYLNVGQMNQAEDAEVTVYNQYRPIMGSVAGRQLGLPAMRAVWKGALHSGLFAKNHEKQCFHEGCSKYPGNASLIDIALDGGSRDANTFPDVYKKFAIARATPAIAMASRAMPVVRAGGGMLRGLGFLGAAPARPADAVRFVDQFFTPANSAPSPCSGHPCYWAAPSNAVERQILYDVADAWLASRAIQTVPYIAKAQPAPAIATPVRAPAGGTVASAGSASSGAAGSVYDMVPITNAQGGTTYVPADSKLVPRTAGVSDLSGTTGALLVAAGVIFAMARPDKQPTRKGPLR